MLRHARSNRPETQGIALRLQRTSQPVLRVGSALRFAAIAFFMVALASATSNILAEERDFRCERAADATTVFMRGKRIFEYRSAEDARKPYVVKLYTPAGAQVLRDSPSDHQHHHGLMLALGVDDVNFWHESPSPEGPAIIGSQSGSEVRCHLEREERGAERVILTQSVDWLDGDSRPIVHEQRQVSASSNTEATVVMLTWISQLKSADQQKAILLNGERYFGLGVRYVQEMDTNGTFLFADDRTADPVPKGENLIRASWCAYLAEVDGKEVSVAMFSHSANRRHPTMWFTMVEPFAYLSATLDLQDRPLELPAGETLTLTYALALADARLTRDEIEQLYRAWLLQNGPSD